MTVIDKDLEFLQNCSDKDLDNLVNYLVYDTDKEKRYTQELTKKENYIKYYPKHKKYLNDIIHELQCYGGNTIVNSIRSCGVSYREIVEDICKKYDLEFSKNDNIEVLEDKILGKILEDSIDRMNDKQRRELLKDIDKKGMDITKQSLVYALQGIIKMGGFNSYKLSLIVANSVSKQLIGRGLSFVANQTLTKSISIFSGPIGLALNALWIASVDIAGPAYRVTIPAVLEITYLRKKCKTKILLKN
jgi:uncharacterized protein YaaW (UPF0174 family)